MLCSTMIFTAGCAMFLIKLRWPTKKNIYVIYKRYGQETLSKYFREYKNDISRYNNVSLNISFLRKCKLFHFFSNFLKFKFSLRISRYTSFPSFQGKVVSFRAEKIDHNKEQSSRNCTNHLVLLSKLLYLLMILTMFAQLLMKKFQL